uniref:Uncharacterized protein n=1 Tax=Glossina pallidipes TaxID=7398 RepID=A0A1B0A796_GLOPL
MRDSPEVLPDPFKRRTRIQRSPEQLGGKTTQERSQFSPPILQDKSLMIKKGENSYVELGEKIGELIEMMAPTPSAPARRTIHQPMKDLVVNKQATALYILQETRSHKKSDGSGANTYDVIFADKSIRIDF